MKDLIKRLEKIGFTNKKAKIYLALLELGAGSVIDITKITGIKRTTIYNILPEMIQEGLIKTGIRNGRKIFFIDDPRQILRNLEIQKKNVEEMVSDLIHMQNVLPQKPKVTFYEGEGGMQELYQDTLDSAKSGDTILSYTGLKDFYKLMPYEYYKWYVKERVKRKIKLRVITYDTKASQEWKKNAQKELREVKIVKNKSFIFNADTEIYSNKVALISYKENFLGVVIESKEISEMQKSVFNIMWDSLPNS